MTHIRFDDGNSSGDEDAAMEEEAPPGASTPPAGVLAPHCCGGVRVDYSAKDPAYVFRVVCSPPGQPTQLAASLSNQLVKLFSVSGADITHTANLSGHTGTITGLEYAPSLVLTCSTDGTVRAWDTRSAQQVQTFNAPGQELQCFSAQEQLVAAGGQGEVFFWDRRTGRQVATLDDTHMEDVTQVRFCPSSPALVVSASVDGLIAVHDTRQPLTHDDAFVAATNVETSVEEVGLYGPHHERLWARTGTETLHLWEWGRAATEQLAGGEAAFANFSDARDVAGATAATAGGDVAAAFQEGVQYIAGCHYDAPSGRLMMMAGWEGAVGFWPIQEQPCPTTGAMLGAQLGAPAALLAGGHTAVVRSVQCVGPLGQGVAFVSGGEDAQICLWTTDPSLPPRSSTLPAPGAYKQRARGTPQFVGGRGRGSGRGFAGPGAAGRDGPGRHGDRGAGSSGHTYRRMAPY